MLRYSDKIFDLREQISGIKDRRISPRVETPRVSLGAMVMTLSQWGSLNELEQRRGHRFWHRWIGADIPSADTVGEVSCVMDCDAVRRIIKKVYSQLKRNKTLKPAFEHGFSLIIDGHESHSSYLRCCEGCLQRVIHKSSGDQIQYYHRHVMAQLMCGNFYLPLDMEPQRHGEDEVSAATRLLERVLENYSRAFSLILADGLYVRSPFFQLVIKHGKDAIAVLKDERRDLLKDAMGVFKLEKPKIYEYGSLRRECWDVEHFRSWTQLDCDVRVVRSREAREIKRQMTKEIEQQVSDWVWVGTIPQERLDTEQFVNFGHGRWKIENNGFNELVNYWHANHVYCHHPNAIEFFWLITMLAYILFHAFIQRNLRPEIREKYTKKYLAATITAELSKIFIPP